MQLKVTPDEGFSEHFMEDFKRLSDSAKNVLKYVQDIIDDKEVPTSYVFGDNKKAPKGLTKKVKKTQEEKSKLLNDPEFIEFYREEKRTKK